MRMMMAGIDHSKATIEDRQQFSFTKEAVKEALTRMKNRDGVEGCLLLSTCNRTELWISGDRAPNPYELLCSLKGLPAEAYSPLFVIREGKDAVDHLLDMTCGFDSKIFGEDQIISQVREALFQARACKSSDSVIEKLFQGALSAAKKVKTKIHIERANPSVATAMMEILKEKGLEMEGTHCLVIGNGQMGRLAARELRAKGAKVFMTQRKHMHREERQEVYQEGGIIFIPYEDRLVNLWDKKVIVSATMSPHYTLRGEDATKFLSNNGEHYLFDLAVPRDIDVEIGKIPGVWLLDTDTLGVVETEEEKNNYKREAGAILAETREALERSFSFREHVPIIEDIVTLVSDDTSQRLWNTPHKEKIEALEVEHAVKKATGKLIYGLKDTLPKELWQKCISSLHEAALKDTLKH